MDKHTHRNESKGMGNGENRDKSTDMGNGENPDKSENADKSTDIDRDKKISSMRERTLYAPIIRVDAAHREVTVRATSTAVDSFHTRFSYEASLDAFRRWIGNVREMHQAKAVGTRVFLLPDEFSQSMDVVIKISRGAEDTWQKLLDGTLKGASIGASDVEWQMGKDGIPEAIHYNLVELSLVDNPSNPDCRVLVIRNDELARMRTSEGRGAVPANALVDLAPNPLRDPPGDMVGSLQPPIAHAPHASDYGVPPPVNATATPGNDGESYTKTTTSGAFWEGGHPDNRPQITEQLHAMRQSALIHADQVLRACGCQSCQQVIASLGAATQRGQLSGEESTQLVGRFQELTAIIATLTKRVEQLAGQPMAGGPVAMATRGFTSLPLGEQIATLQTFAAKTNDPAVQMAAAAAILQLQRQQ